MKQADTQIIRRLNEIYDAQAAGGAASFASLTGSPSDNAALDSALDAKQSEAEVQTIADAKVVSGAYGPDWNGDTTHSPARNDVYDKIEAVVASIPTAPYLVYAALLSQSGTDVPVATVLGTPTIPGPFLWTRTSAGNYRLTSDANPFTNAAKIAVILSGGLWHRFDWSSDDSSRISLSVRNTADQEEDNLLLNSTLRIEVYP